MELSETKERQCRDERPGTPPLIDLETTLPPNCVSPSDSQVYHTNLDFVCPCVHCSCSISWGWSVQPDRTWRCTPGLWNAKKLTCKRKLLYCMDIWRTVGKIDL